MSAKQAINDKLQGIVATCLRCGGVVNNQIKNGLLLNLWVKKIVKISAYLAKLQARTWLSRALVRLANTLLKDGESARNDHVLACNFAKYSPILIFSTHSLSNKPFLIWLLTTPPHLVMHTTTTHYSTL